jgi:HK97 family phage prohead protease
MLKKSPKAYGTHELAIGPENCKVNVVTDDATPAGFVEGYASVFNNVDLGGDIMEPGAFKKTLKERLKTGDIKLVDSHLVFREGTDAIIGGVTDAKEDETGLWFKGVFSSVQRAQDIRTKIREKFLNALSFGFDIIKAEADKTDKNVRRIKEVRLYEISMVPWGMNPKAQLTLAKGAQSASAFATSGHAIDSVDAAKQRWVEYVGGGGDPEDWTPAQWRIYAKGFLWVEDEKESLDAYKLLVVDVLNEAPVYNFALADAALKTARSDAAWMENRPALEKSLEEVFTKFGVALPSIEPPPPQVELADEEEIAEFHARMASYKMLMQARAFNR